MTRILIVDDEPNSCSVLGIRFKRKGFEVETLTDWKAADPANRQGTKSGHRFDRPET